MTIIMPMNAQNRITSMSGMIAGAVGAMLRTVITNAQVLAV